jgi:hypothetical protein
MDFAQFLNVIDRVGAPMAILLLGAWVVRGPVNRFADLAGGAIGRLCKAGIDYLTQATERLNGLPGHISIEAERTRSHVTEEAAHVREHVSEELLRLRGEAPALERDSR